MAKDTFDRKTRDILPQKWQATYTYVNENKQLRRGVALTEAANAEDARTAIATDLRERYGDNNFRIIRVTIW